MKHNTKILFLITGMGRGGGETQVRYVSTELQNRGWDVTVCTLIDRLEQPEEFRSSGVKLKSMSLPKGQLNPYSLVKAIREVRKINPEVVITFTYTANILGRLIKNISGIKHLITSIRNERFDGIGREYLLRYTRFLDSYATTNSSKVYNDIINKRFINPSNSKVIRNAIEISTNTPKNNINKINKLKYTLNIDSNEFIWVAVGNHRQQKAYPVLIDALTKINYPFKLLLVGKTYGNSEIENLVNKLGLNNSVQVLGKREDVPDLLALSNAFVMSSNWEGMPNAMIEAMAMGLPVVSTNVGGVSELVKENRNGYLVPPGDPEALCKAMKRMMALPNEDRNKMGKQSEGTIKKDFKTKDIIDQWEELFSELLAS